VFRMTGPMWGVLGEKVEPNWGPERDRAARVKSRRRQAPRRAGTPTLSLALVAGGVGAFLHLRAPASEQAPTLTSPSPATAETVTHLVPETTLDPIADRHGRGFALRLGGARFTVPHGAQRPARAVPAEKPARAPGGPDVASSWRALAERGRYEEAHAALKKAGPDAVRDQTADLLLAADTARLGGFPAAALPYLERVVRAHAGDPRAGLASFTLGRVLLDELGRPREAADAFARARAAGSPLAEDALAREVEATSRAGDTARSRELAHTYQHLYPHGGRAKAVSRFGEPD
jgi:hypothetical protein